MSKITGLSLLAFFAVSCTAEPTASHTTAADQPVIGMQDTYTGGLQLDAGNNNDFDFDQDGTYRVKILELVPHASGSTVTGISGASAADKDTIWVCNVDGTLPITFANENEASMLTGRLHFADGHDLLLWPMSCFLIEWNVAIGHWIEMASSRTHDVYATSISSRTLNTIFQPHTMHVVDVHYNVTTTCTTTLLSGRQAGRVELRIGPTSPPTTVVEATGCDMTGGLAITTAPTSALNASVPIGYYAELVTVTVAGSPAYAVSADQLEEVR
jgi:hypothetical protein